MRQDVPSLYPHETIDHTATGMPIVARPPHPDLDPVTRQRRQSIRVQLENGPYLRQFLSIERRRRDDAVIDVSMGASLTDAATRHDLSVNDVAQHCRDAGVRPCKRTNTEYLFINRDDEPSTIKRPGNRGRR